LRTGTWLARADERSSLHLLTAAFDTSLPIANAA
jgi:hypothetical protein